MITFEVNDMTCGHCVSSITKAIHAVDQGARLTAHLATHTVQIEAAALDVAALGNAIRDAGYTPVPIAGGGVPAAQPAPRSGCCCR